MFYNPYFKLPPLAPDFSAVASFLYNFNSFDIIYSPGCCYTSIREVDEERDLSSKSLYTTKLDDVDIATSGIKKIISDLEQVDLEKFEFLSLIGTFVTDATGVNLKREAMEIQKVIRKNTFFFKCNGFDSYSLGIQESINKLGSYALTKIQETRKEKTINILGYHSMIHGNKTHVNHLKEYLSIENVKIEIFGLPDEENKEVYLHSGAALNIVISQEAKGLAEFMEAKYGVPYIVALPFGIKPMINFLEKVEKIIGSDYSNKINYLLDKKNKLVLNKKSLDNIVVFGEPFIITELAKMLYEDYNIDNIILISYFDKRSKEGLLFSGKRYEEVIFTKEERIIIKMIKNGDIIIADPLCKGINKKYSMFFSLPYAGMSGKFNIDKTPALIGHYFLEENRN